MKDCSQLGDGGGVAPDSQYIGEVVALPARWRGGGPSPTASRDDPQQTRAVIDWAHAMEGKRRLDLALPDCADGPSSDPAEGFASAMLGGADTTTDGR